MAASTFDDALRRLLTHEGGYANHPSDPGGPTKYGITLATYRDHLGRAVTADDVRAMSVDAAKAIYRTQYWASLRCDELPAGLDYALFDYGVNTGIGRAAKVLQRLVGEARLTGGLSDATIARVRARDPRRLIAELCDERLAFLRALRTFPVFGKGWTRRVAEVRAVALALAEGAAAGTLPATPARGPGGKGVPPTGNGTAAGAAGAIAVAGGAVAQGAHDAGVSPTLVMLLVAATLAAACAAFLGWRAWRRRQAERPFV